MEEVVLQFLLVKDKSGLSSDKKSEIKESFIDTNSILCDHIEYEWESEDNTLYFIGRNPKILIYNQYGVFNTDNNNLTFIHGWVKKEDKDYMLTANEINNEIIDESELDGYYIRGKINSKGSGNLYRSLFSPNLYYSKSGDVFAISNRISTLSKLFDYNNINKKYLASQIEYHGKALTFDTMYEDVYQVPYGTEISISDDLILNRIHDFLYDPELQSKYHQNEDEYWDECNEKVSSQLKAFANLGIEENIELGITGGKDSRVLLSLCHKYLSYTWTWGPAFSPEVIVGRMCSEKVKLNHTPRSMREINDPENKVNLIPGHLFNTEFERSPWDLHELQEEINDAYNIDGQEMVKAKPYKDDKTIEDILDILDNVHNDSNVILDETNNAVKIDNHEIALEYLNDMENINKFPIIELALGLGRWRSFNHDFRFSFSFVIGPLLTNSIVKYNYNSSADDIGNLKLYYELMKRNCPDLLEIPLFNAKFDQVEGFHIENKVHAKLNNKTMFLLRYFDFLKGYILENYDLISDIVKKSFILDLNKDVLLNDYYRCFILYDVLQLVILLKNPDFKNLKYLDLDLPEISTEKDRDNYDNDCVLAFIKYNEDIIRLKNENKKLNENINENNRNNARLTNENKKLNVNNKKLNENNRKLNDINKKLNESINESIRTKVRLENENKKLNDNIDELVSSNSWKITKPLRKLRRR
jgi:hypothetical protein